MKVRGVLITHTEDKRVLKQRVPVKLDKTGRYITATIDDSQSKFVLPLFPNPETPILYAITGPLPLEQDYVQDLSKRYLAVTIKC